MKITIAQLNPTVGDVRANASRAGEIYAKFAGTTDLIIFPELFLVAYPPRDLLENPAFIAGVNQAVGELIQLSRRFPETGLILGAPMPSNLECGKRLYNAALLLYQGQMWLQAKSLLPTYDVFDETRYFASPTQISVFNFKDQVLGISICEDAWYDFETTISCRLYDFDPIQELARQGATLLINISASPFYYGKEEVRYQIIRQHCQKHHLPFLYVNQVGGNDELIFDGSSLAMNAQGELLKVFSSFREEIATVDLSRAEGSKVFHPMEKIASVHEALVLGLRDYLRKCGFSKAVVGLSGGVDSAVTCYLARLALGPENVLGVIMPSLYSSPGSITDSEELAANLGVKTITIPITPIYQSYLDSLKEHFPVTDLDVSLENIQARIRGNILMFPKL
jgi:NAD+ synthase (glutamine-hydrolysing)